MKDENYDVEQNGSDKSLNPYKTDEPETMTFNEIDLSGTYSYASYLSWTFEERLELIKGKIFQMSAPTTKHQICTGSVFAELHQFLKGKPCRVFISPFDVRFLVILYPIRKCLLYFSQISV
ncbi:Uma2 family endonuclease [Pedobacter sp. ASV1-7]|uniref:Uma2 family endonuclease n=1 Tax=Pedobacter sp. ASV1-7 TaxID=3145237 RepID=UPI0032E8A49D